MRIFWTLFRRELSSFFVSLTGYVIIAAVTLLTGASFLMLIRNLGSDPFLLPVTELFFNSLLFWIVVVLVTPVITMRLFALEKASGTFETLMTTPVGDLAVVLAKFAAALFFYMIMWLPTIGVLFIVAHFTNETSALDPGMVEGTCLGIFLSGALFISLGCFTSSLTRNQVVAAMLSLAAGVILIIAAYLAQVIPATAGWQMQLVLFYLNFFHQMEDFTRGAVDTRTVVFYLSLTLLFLFLTLRVVESRRWK
jgi:ABC-2 type transport system permease protein